MSSPSPSMTSSFATSIASLPSPPGPSYHPDFTGSSGLNADVTFVARDGVRFRVNATVLRLKSGYFMKTLPPLPQSVEMEWKEPVIDYSLDGDSEVLEDLLRFVSNKEIRPDRFISLDDLQPRLLAAEKWDMPGVLSIMRILLRTNPDISSSDPMRVYWLGSHFGWTDVMSAASKYSCHDDLFCPDKQSLLGQVDVTDLLRLMNFHKDRKDKMTKHLFGDENCIGRLSQSTEYRNFAWNVLQLMDHIPPARKLSHDDVCGMKVETSLGAFLCRTYKGSTRDSWKIFTEINRFWDSLQQKMTV